MEKKRSHRIPVDVSDTVYEEFVTKINWGLRSAVMRSAVDLVLDLLRRDFSAFAELALPASHTRFRIVRAGKENEK